MIRPLRFFSIFLSALCDLSESSSLSYLRPKTRRPPYVKRVGKRARPLSAAVLRPVKFIT